MCAPTCSFVLCIYACNVCICLFTDVEVVSELEKKAEEDDDNERYTFLFPSCCLRNDNTQITTSINNKFLIITHSVSNNNKWNETCYQRHQVINKYTPKWKTNVRWTILQLNYFFASPAKFMPLSDHCYMKVLLWSSTKRLQWKSNKISNTNTIFSAETYI